MTGVRRRPGRLRRALEQHQRLLILLGMVALLVVAATLDPVHDAVSRMADLARQVIRHHEGLGMALFCLLSAVSAILFFFSNAVIVPVAVHTWGKPTTIFLLWGSWLVGAMISYFIGRHPGRRVAKWVAPGRRVAEYEKKISANASFPVVLLFQLAVPSEIPGYVLGALRYPFARYLGARAIAEAPFAVGAVLLGDSFMRRQTLPLVVIAAAGVLLSATAVYFLSKRMGARSGGARRSHARAR